MRRSLLLLTTALCLSAIYPASATQPAKVEFLNSGKVLPTNLPFSEAVRVNDTLFLSGQIGIEPGTLKLAPGGLKEETLQAMSNIKITLEAHGFTMSDLVKCTVMLSDMSKWDEFNDVYRTFFVGQYPSSLRMHATKATLPSFPRARSCW
jgi:reactive intermediate/imine deaminase